MIHLEQLTGGGHSSIELAVHEGGGTQFFHDGVEICDLDNKAAAVATDLRQFLDLRDAEYADKTRHQAFWEVAIQQDAKGFWQFMEMPVLLENVVPASPKPENPLAAAFRRSLRKKTDETTG